MDLEEFKKQFITEAKEKLSEADECLDKLQKGYDNNTLVDLKRSFHTLKGNSAAMGFQKYFELAKAGNDLAQRAIDKEVELDGNVVSLLKKCKEELNKGLQFIEEGNPESLTADDLVHKIQKV
ncbi:MAG: Hpt domain-containing protein [Nanoarchaeota archaeon]